MTFYRRQDDRSSPPPLYSTNYPLRMFVCARAIVVALLALFEENSINHTLLVAGERWPAIATMLALIVVGALGVFDCVINDLAPPRMMIRWFAEHRHLGFLALAAIDIGFTFIVVGRGYEGVAMLTYILDATASIWIAIYHVRHRYVVPRKARSEWVGGHFGR